MQALFCTQPENFEYKDIPLPVLREDYALLKIQRIGICGTDLHAFEGTQPYFNYPRILGHELSAEMINPNGVNGFKVGDIVTCIPYFNCGNCIACRKGKPNCCAHIQVFGVHIDGGMAEFITVPHYSLVHGNGLDADQLALVEPLSIGAHAVSRAEIQKNEFVLVIGAGPIGIGTMEFTKIAGATVIALDINEGRLAFCKNQIQIPYTINAASNHVIDQLKEITHGDMPSVVFDATGNLNAINHAFQYLSHAGKYVLVGLQKGEISFSHPAFHKREATLMSSRNATRKDFEFVISNIKNELIHPANYITHRVLFNEVKDVFASWLNPANGVIKAMVEF